MKNKKQGIGLIVTVVIIAVIAVVIATILLVVNTGKDKSTTNQDNVQNPNSNSTQEQVNNEDKEWGVEDKLTASNSQGTESFHISLPDHVGALQGTGSIGKQADGSMVLVDSQDRIISQDITGLSKLFPTYFAQTESVLKGYYRMRGANFSFEILEQSEVKINGYDMVKFSGTHSYTYEQEPVSCNWVAYATQLKSNGAYVYWMVLDAAENKISTSNIEETARKMAFSLKEDNN